MTLRIAIVGQSPCEHCYAACCRQNGHDYAALLRGAERRRFAAFSIEVPIRSDGGIVLERVLPYVDGRCQFLGDDDRCTIYEDRPQACRDFQCVPHFHADGVGRHRVFLQRNPRVLKILEDLNDQCPSPNAQSMTNDEAAMKSRLPHSSDRLGH
jgi:Fe-S-cluster containining protein